MQTNRLQRWLFTALKISVAIFLLLAACVGYLGYRAQSAKRSVDAFCASVRVGQPTQGLAERARAAGLEVHELPSPPVAGDATGGVLMCMNGVMLARHICQITYSSGRVISKDQSFVD